MVIDTWLHGGLYIGACQNRTGAAVTELVQLLLLEALGEGDVLYCLGNKRMQIRCQGNKTV